MSSLGSSYLAWCLLILAAWTLAPYLFDAATRGRAPSLRAIARAPEWGLFLGLIAMLGVITLLDPQRAFFSPSSQRTMFHDIGMYGVLALGAAIVIISGGIDLSTGAVVALTSVFSAKLVTQWLPALTGRAEASGLDVAVVVALTLLLGLAIGLLHALLINRFELPPFIATLATMAGLRSVAVILSENRKITVPDPAFRILGQSAPITIGIFLSVALALSLMMGATVLGRRLYALGGNEAAARLSGLRTNRLRATAYALSGMLSALGGILFTGKGGQGDGTMGTAFELIAITAAVVGGCRLAGGVGSIRGTAFGLVLIQTIIKGTGLVVRPFTVRVGNFSMSFFQGINSTQIEGLVLGTVVVLAVAFNQRFRKRL